jgi:adenine-specific DNA-methyltransferase
MERTNGRKILEDIIESFSIEKFIHFFREKNRNFRPLSEKLDYYRDDYFTSGKIIGEIEFQNEKKDKLITCAFQSLKELTERSGKKKQYEIGKRILKDTNRDAGIFIFYDRNGNFRFSLIYTEYSGTRRKYSFFKRFTYFVSKEKTNKTFLQQIGQGDFSSLEKIKEAFSVEPVTKQFYEEIQNWYFWAMDKVEFPEDYKYSNDPEKDKEIRNATNLIRLITRLIFIWFIKEKGLIPEILFEPEKLKDIVKDFGKGHNYYNAILQNLFFATLNQKMGERKFAAENGFHTNKKEYGVKTLFRYADKFLIPKEKVLEIFKDIPFLNGGLFDCLDKEDESGKVIYIDGFSRNPKKQAKIPDYLFFQKEEVKVDLSKYGLGSNKKVRGLIEILKSYNFTIDENTPIDQEIALDPELLGKVFENLLACYNPETATTARKATGSYYTPREIVDYMVEESLKEYFKNKFPDIDEQKLEMLLSYSEDIPEFSEEERKKLISSIADIKILDPACGSGAFPMGILQKLVHLLQRLDPDNKYWYELQYERAIKASEEVFKEKDKVEREEMLKEINEAFDESINYPDYARKLYLIENCIYGVDIQPIAIQISKLRFFISLVIDQKVDKTKENLGIRPLPNLETKFVAANTLIGLERPKQIFQLPFLNQEIEKKKKELKNLRHRYFTAKTRAEKIRLQEKDKKIRQEIAELLIKDGWPDDTAHKISSFDPFDQNSSADWFDPEWMFGVKDGFDIVIGNPPYGAKYDQEHKKYFLDNYITAKTVKGKYKGSLDTYTLFIEKGFNLLKINGNLIFIVPISITSSDSVENLHNLLEKNCKFIKISSYAVRPQQIFQNSVVDVSIISFLKTLTPAEKILCTKMYRKSKDISVSDILNNLEFIDVKEFKLKGRYPKISYQIEKSILQKIFDKNNTPIVDLIRPQGKPIYYRSAGGRYFKIVTNYSTGSTAEKKLYFDKNIADVIGAILSSNLFFWFYQIYSDNHNLRLYEILSFPIPYKKLLENSELIEKIKEIYNVYLNDIERNAVIRKTTQYKKITEFKEYKIKKSKHIIDKIDELICPLYGMTKEEIEFLKNYEIKFRLGDEDSVDEDENLRET